MSMYIYIFISERVRERERERREVAKCVINELLVELRISYFNRVQNDDKSLVTALSTLLRHNSAQLKRSHHTKCYYATGVRHAD